MTLQGSMTLQAGKTQLTRWHHKVWVCARFVTESESLFVPPLISSPAFSAELGLIPGTVLLHTSKTSAQLTQLLISIARWRMMVKRDAVFMGIPRVKMSTSEPLYVFRKKKNKTENRSTNCTSGEGCQHEKRDKRGAIDLAFSQPPYPVWDEEADKALIKGVQNSDPEGWALVTLEIKQSRWYRSHNTMLSCYCLMSRQMDKRTPHLEMLMWSTLHET